MIADELRQRLKQHGQDHLLAMLDTLGDAERAQMLNELSRIDLAELQKLHARREQKDVLPERHRIEPLPYPTVDKQAEAEYFEQGMDAIMAGKVAYLVVAGGQ